MYMKVLVAFQLGLVVSLLSLGTVAERGKAEKVAQLGLFQQSAEDLARTSRTFEKVACNGVSEEECHVLRKSERIGFTAGWVWANVVAEDGTPYFLLREHGTGTSTMYAIIGTSSDIRSNPRPISSVSPGLDNLYSGRSNYEPLPEGDGHVVSSQNPRYSPFRISLKQGEIHWTDADEIDLTFTSLGPALALRLPYGDDDVGYTSEHMRVKGVYNGQQVTGYGGYDRAYTESAYNWLQCSMFRNLEQGWLVWSGKNEHGAMEYGWAIMGPRGFGVGGFIREGEPPLLSDRVTRTVETEIINGVKLPTSVTVDIDGRKFKFTSSGLLNFPNPEIELKWVYGETSEVGGPKLVNSHSMIELFRDSFFDE